MKTYQLKKLLIDGEANNQEKYLLCLKSNSFNTVVCSINNSVKP